MATWLCVVAVMASPANHLGVRITSACSVLGSTWVGAVLAAVVVGGLLSAAIGAVCWLLTCSERAAVLHMLALELVANEKAVPARSSMMQAYGPK
jgi:hypothetical protein